jgi:hypothetical protein
MRFSLTSLQKSKRIYPRRIAAGVGIGFGIALLLWLVWMGVHVYDLVNLSRELKGMGEINLQYDWSGAASRLVADVDGLQTGAQPIFLAASLIPEATPFGHAAHQVEQYLSFSSDMAHCAEILAHEAGPVLVALQGKSGAVGIDQIFLSLSQHTQGWTSAEKAYQSALEKRAGLDPAILPEPYRGYFKKIDENFALLGFGIQIVQQVPDLAGFNQPKTYLLLAQNNDELRATGGFISGIGTVKIANGKIAQFTLGDSYRIDDFSKPYPPPPLPIQKFMLAGYWVARDANWAPDFPASASKISEIYTLSTGEQTDGAIAFDPTAIKGLLSIFGPISVPSIDQPVTSANVDQYMQESSAPGARKTDDNTWWLHRKDFMQQLGGELFKRVVQPSGVEQYIKLASLLKDLIQSGHLLVYFTAEQVQSAFTTAGLDGQVKFGPDPAFMLVDSNIGFNKMDAVMQRSVDYQIDWSSPGEPVATIRMTYQNPVKKEVACQHIASYGDGTYLDMETRCYWDYWRVYLPANSQLLSISSPDVPADWNLSQANVHNPVEIIENEDGAAVIGGLAVIPPGKTQEINLKVRLPPLKPAQPAAGNQDFSLTFFKQPGLETLPMTLKFQFPSQVKLCGPAAPETSEASSNYSWTGQISQTLQLHFCAAGN